MLTLRDLCERLEITRPVALRLVKKLPGAAKRAQGGGKMERWEIPDDALDSIDDEMLDAAKAEAAAGSTAPASPPTEGRSGVATTDPALREEALAVDRERLAAERARAETERLEAETRRARAERDLESARGGTKSGADPVVADRLSRLERLVERVVESATQRPAPDSTAGVTELVKAAVPLLAPLMERLAAPSTTPATTPALGPAELLSLAGQLKALIAPPESSLRRDIGAAFREGVDIGRARAGAEAGDGGGGGLVATVNSIIQGLAPYVPSIIEGVRGLSGPARAAPDAAPERALRSAPPAQPSGGDAPMAINPLKEILDAVLEELTKPVAERDLPGVAAFLESIVLNEAGDTFLDRLAPLARTPDRLAKLSARLIDPRFSEPDAWPGVRALLDHLSGAVIAQPPPGAGPSSAATSR